MARSSGGALCREEPLEPTASRSDRMAPCGRGDGCEPARGDHSPPDDMNDVPEVLFVCVHNAGRSQMAAGLLAKYAGPRIVVRSAGSAPADEVNPAVVEVMREVDVDVSREFPKALTADAVEAS